MDFKCFHIAYICKAIIFYVPQTWNSQEIKGSGNKLKKHVKIFFFCLCEKEMQKCCNISKQNVEQNDLIVTEY